MKNSCNDFYKFPIKFLISFFVLTSNYVFSNYSFPVYFGNESKKVVNFFSNTTNYKFSISSINGKAKLNQGTIKEYGLVYGIRSNYDIVIANGLYLGGELGYKFSSLKGENNNNEKIFFAISDNFDELISKIKCKSKYYDFWSEIRLGFTYEDMNSNFILIPYLSVGYEKEKNKYISPSVITYKEFINYGYFAFGVISDLTITENLNLGINAKIKWLFDSYVKSAGNYYLKGIGFVCVDFFHWEVEIPLTYFINDNLLISISPFYQYKNYLQHQFAYAKKENCNFYIYGSLINLGITF